MHNRQRISIFNIASGGTQSARVGSPVLPKGPAFESLHQFFLLQYFQ